MFQSLPVQQNILLSGHTTMRAGGQARWFAQARDEKSLLSILAEADGESVPVFILGGGSNVLFSDSGFDGLVLKPCLKGIRILNENADSALISVAAGEIWDDVVDFTVRKNWWGLENLSLIPGLTGALPIQNVGAYGTEAADMIETVSVFDRQKGIKRDLSAEECRFSYRESRFNTTDLNRFVILKMTFKCTKNPCSVFSHAALAEKFKSAPPASSADVRGAVIDIRNSKLPDPEKIGSAGSCFKNPVIRISEMDDLLKKAGKHFSKPHVEKLSLFENRFSDGKICKIPAAFLIEACGCKNDSVGGASLYEKHALIIVNRTGQARAADVMGLIKTIRQKVFAKTGVILQPEPVFAGFTGEELSFYNQL